MINRFKDMKNLPTNKNFGIVFFIVFLIIGIFPILKGNNLNYGILLISVIFLILGIINSRILTPLNITWYKFGILLGKIISPIIMGLIFFLVVTPIGLILKLVGKDVLRLSINKKTYWINKDKYKSEMKNQF